MQDKKKAIKKVGWGLTAAAGTLAAAIAVKNAEDIDYEAAKLEAIPIEKSVDEDTLSDVDEKHSSEILKAEANEQYITLADDTSFTYADTPFTQNIQDDENITRIYLDMPPNEAEGLRENASKYEDAIQEASKRWGVSAVIIRGILMQEGHGGTIDNPMRIDLSRWEGQRVRVYNFETNKYVTIVLTDHPENYDKVRDNIDQLITSKDLKNKETSIKTAAALFQNNYNHLNHNLSLSLFTYNGGAGNKNKLLKLTTAGEGITEEEILADETNVSFMKYTPILFPDDKYGDSEYLNNVGSKIYGEPITMKYIEDGEIKEKTSIIEYRELEKVK